MNQKNTNQIELLFQLYHNFSVKVFHAKLNHKARDLNRLNYVLQYTNDHYKNPIALEEIAQVAFLEPGYFCRFFKKHMGLTYVEYLN